MVTDFPEIKEVDMNPVKVLEDSLGLIVMDAKAIIEENFITVKPKEKSETDKVIA